MIEPLPVLERRALGVLVEKALTAAAPEPLTLNAVVLGCNQKSNREPVMNVEEPEAEMVIEQALMRKRPRLSASPAAALSRRHNFTTPGRCRKPELAFSPN